MTEKSLKPAVVLVADRTLSGNYKILFEGIFATMQTTQVPEFVMRNLVSPKTPTDQLGRAHTAPLGLRRLESALLHQSSLTEADLVVTTWEKLPQLLGPWTKIVGFSSSDPLGSGMSNTTTTSFWDGELYTRHWTARMLAELRAAKQKYNFKIIAGGAGAWQWSLDPEHARKQGIDTIFEGYSESTGPQLFQDLLNGKSAPAHQNDSTAADQDIRPIDRASLLGIVELSRGCGRGCGFCSMAHKKMHHLPLETIIADIETNVANGLTSVVSGSEDFFRYGSDSLKPDFEKLHELLIAMRKVRNLSFMQIDHANITSVAQLTDEQLRETRELLKWQKPSRYLWVNLGVESANGQLVAKNSTGKIAPYRPDDWEDIVRDSIHRLDQSGFYPVISLVLGLPGETPADVERTLKLVKDFEKQRAVVFPIFYEPLQSDDIAAGNKFDLGKMRQDHLELYSRCYEINFRNVPKLFWDNQRAGGVSWGKRALMRVLGKTEVHAWRKKFTQLRKTLPHPNTAEASQAKPFSCEPPEALAGS